MRYPVEFFKDPLLARGIYSHPIIPDRDTKIVLPIEGSHLYPLCFRAVFQRVVQEILQCITQVHRVGIGNAPGSLRPIVKETVLPLHLDPEMFDNGLQCFLDIQLLFIQDMAAFFKRSKLQYFVNTEF